jgi:hypothetical protein
MLSCTTSVAWSHPVSSPCYTEHGQRCGAILSGRIITVALSRSDQLGLRCTIEPNYSGMSARLVGASVTRDRALDTCGPNCVPGAAKHFFIPMVHIPLGGRGVRGSTGALVSGRRDRVTWHHRSPPRQGGEVRS